MIGYVLSERGALKLLRYLTFAKIELPIDLQIYKVPGLAIYYHTPRVPARARVECMLSD